MKILLHLLVCALLASSLQAAAPHPTVLTVKYKDQMLPVVRVIGTDPVVLVDGKEKRIRTEPSYLPQRAEGYSSESVEFHSVSLGGMELKVVADVADEADGRTTTGPRFGTTYFKASVQSKRTLKGAFMVIVMYSPLAFMADSKSTRPEIMVHDLPELPAGQRVSVDFSAAVFDGLPAMQYFIQVFDSTGREIPTALMGEAWKYYRIIEEGVLLPNAIARYREKYKGMNHAAVPMIMPKPYLPDSLTPPKTEVTALMTIAPEGVVRHASLTGVEDAAVEKQILQAMEGWLFLPKLSAGEPVDCIVQVPLRF